MFSDLSSATAFAPPPDVSLYVPTDSFVDRAPPAQSRRQAVVTQANTTASTVTIDQLAPFQTREKSAMAAHARRQLELLKRIQFLRVEAEIDSVPFSEASHSEFLAFMRSVRPTARPSLFLNDNGNLRALWKSEQREQIGLQFLGGGQIQFVIFKYQREHQNILRQAGVGARTNILAIIHETGATELLLG